ncbi:hypothetical protein MMC20_002539 [Loxospora ochrophaea]|nr:hypothetical protein [Loxospora ochrophaea]
MSSSPESSSQLAGKVAITTGSSSSIGRAISLACTRKGAKIICADLALTARREIEKETLIATHELVQSYGGEAIFMKTDVSSGEDMKD